MIETAGVPECTRCGTCCFSQNPEYLSVAGVDYERLGDDAERLTHFLGNKSFMRLEDGHCAALGLDAERGLFLCSVYERRPDVCRWLERGSGQCRADLHEKSERPLLALQALKRLTSSS